jgi:branched-chain amino acid transport system ATP-binding protein
MTKHLRNMHKLTAASAAKGISGVIPEPLAHRREPPSLVVESVRAGYGRNLFLGPITFAVDPGEVVVVLGPNGAGKTTLLKTLAGLVKDSVGDIRVRDQEVGARSAPARARLGLVLVPEGRGVLPGLSVAENLRLGAGVRRAGREARARRIERALDAFPALRSRLKQDCYTLSGGELQMLAIARAIASEPYVLLLDEPSHGLAPKIVTDVYAGLHRLWDEGLAMVIVEQRSVPLWCAPSECMVLRSGRLVYRVKGRMVEPERLTDLYFGTVQQEA